MATDSVPQPSMPQPSGLAQQPMAQSGVAQPGMVQPVGQPGMQQPVAQPGMHPRAAVPSRSATYPAGETWWEKTSVIVERISYGYLGVIILLWYLLSEVSETWWLSTALTYLPRRPYLIPGLILVVVSAVFHRQSVWTNLAAVVIVIWPMAGYQFADVNSAPNEQSINVVSCNVHAFEPSFDRVLKEVLTCNPNIVILQEAYNDGKTVKDYTGFFDGWYKTQVGEYYIASQFPFELLGEIEVPSLERRSAITVKVKSPFGDFLLTNIHQTTARHALDDLSIGSILSGSGPGSVSEYQRKREEEAFTIRTAISEHGWKIPSLVIGDFNMPSSSSIYQRNWSHYQNAFDVAGRGYGFTSPCNTDRLWPNNTPWLRIDHILASNHWRVNHCQVAMDNGSDHRAVAASLNLRRVPRSRRLGE